MKKTIITTLLALIVLTGQGQEKKTAIIQGYSPALKDGSVARGLIDMVCEATDTVVDGHFKLILPVETTTECLLDINGEGCPSLFLPLFIAPNIVTTMTGKDCLFHTWKVESSLPEQTTSNRIMAGISDMWTDFIQQDLNHITEEAYKQFLAKMDKRIMDILPSLPVDAASLRFLRSVCKSREKCDPLYWEQLEALVKTIVDHAPKGFENELADIHALIYPLPILQPGEEAIDTDFFDMQGNLHHLAELRGRYVLLDFWSLSCGPCRMAEAEMQTIYESLNNRLEIVGINRDKPLAWQESEWSQKIVWKNWSDGKMGHNGIETHYCDEASMPYYVLLSPDLHVVWKSIGYNPGQFFGMATALNGPKQDNGKNLSLAVSHVEAKPDGTRVTFRHYGPKDYYFIIAGSSHLLADGKSYKLTSANGITIETETFPSEKASTTESGILGQIYYTNFTLTFEPFDKRPTSFDFIEGDNEGAFVIRNISIEE